MRSLPRAQVLYCKHGVFGPVVVGACGGQAWTDLLLMAQGPHSRHGVFEPVAVGAYGCRALHLFFRTFFLAHW